MKILKLYALTMFVGLMLAMGIMFLPIACAEKPVLEESLTTATSAYTCPLCNPGNATKDNPFAQVMAGDLDLDGEITIADLTIMIDEQIKLAQLDFDGDGRFSANDYTALESYLFVLGKEKNPKGRK